MEPDAVEIRVLGCLLEKQRTTPDAYPLSLNALRLACNQATARDPVVEYDESVIREALQRLARRGWTRMASGAGSRAAKYRQLFDESLRLRPEETALLAVLMLRGAQTPGELKARSDRLARIGGLTGVQATLELLMERGMVQRLARRPGQKEERYVQVLGGGDHLDEPAGGTPADELAWLGTRERAEVDPSGVSGDPKLRLARLEREVAELRAALQELRSLVAPAAD